MNAFIEWLKEKELNEMAPVAVMGDWDATRFKDVSYKRKFEIEKNWTFEGDFDSKKNKFKIYSKDNLYIIGVWGKESDKESFFIISRVQLMRRKDIQDNTSHKKCFQVKKIYTDEDFRGEGITMLFYKWFIFKGYSLVSDGTQYDGPRIIYSKISKDIKFKADVYDSHEHKIIKKDVEIDHGEFWDFDTDLYSHDYSKAHILIILYK